MHAANNICSFHATALVRTRLAAMDNYMMYMGSDGVYTHTIAHERDSGCLMCGSGLPLPASDETTLEQVGPADSHVYALVVAWLHLVRVHPSQMVRRSI